MIEYFLAASTVFVVVALLAFIFYKKRGSRSKSIKKKKSATFDPQQSFASLELQLQRLEQRQIEFEKIISGALQEYDNVKEIRRNRKRTHLQTVEDQLNEQMDSIVRRAAKERATVLHLCQQLDRIEGKFKRKNFFDDSNDTTNGSPPVFAAPPPAPPPPSLDFSQPKAMIIERAVPTLKRIKSNAKNLGEPIKLSDILSVKLRSWRNPEQNEKKTEPKSSKSPQKPKPAWMEKLIQKKKENNSTTSAPTPQTPQKKNLGEEFAAAARKRNERKQTPKKNTPGKQTPQKQTPNKSTPHKRQASSLKRRL